MRYWPVRRKIVSFVLIVIATFLVARAYAEARQSYNIYQHFVVEEAHNTAATLAAAIAQGGYWDNPAQMQGLLSALQAQAGQDAHQVLVTDRNGQVVAASDPAMTGTTLPEDVRRTVSAVMERGVAESITVPGAPRTTGQLAVPIDMGDQRKGVLITQYSQDPARALSRASVQYEVVTFTVMAMAVVLILLVGLRKMVLQPLGVLEEGAVRFGQGDLNTRIELRTGDELETVAKALNRMAGSLKVYQAECVEREKQATLAEVAYATVDELSQPLTVVMGYAELLREQGIPAPEFLDEALRSIQRGSQDMAGILRKLSAMSDDYESPINVKQGA